MMEMVVQDWLWQSERYFKRQAGNAASPGWKPV